MKLAGKQNGNGNGNGSSGGDGTTESNVKVVDFNEARNQKLDEKRRKNERFFFQNMLGVFGVVDHSNVRQLQIVDVSEDGISFMVPFDTKNPWPRESGEMPIRLYFTQDSYLPLQVKVVNSRPMIESGVRYVRYGCSVDTTFQSYETFRQFVRFLKSFSEQAHRDDGSDSVFYL